MVSSMNDSNLEQQILQSAERVINIESIAVANLKQQLNETFVAVCNQLLACQGKVVVIGMGKSGHIVS